MLLSNNVSNRKIEFVDGRNIISSETIYDLSKDTTLVILLSEPKCNKCQEKELKRLNYLKEKIGSNGDQIIGNTTRAKQNDVGIQRKTTKIEFPIYWVADTMFFNHLSFDSEFPQILYIIDGIVQSAFKPVPLDDEFSENYYKHLLAKITKE